MVQAHSPGGAKASRQSQCERRAFLTPSFRGVPVFGQFQLQRGQHSLNQQTQVFIAGLLSVISLGKALDVHRFKTTLQTPLQLQCGGTQQGGVLRKNGVQFFLLALKGHAPQLNAVNPTHPVLATSTWGFGSAIQFQADG